MKHTFDETTMQAAIDAACEALGKGDFRPTAGLLDTVPGCHDWSQETSARLHLLKTALDHLPEPPPAEIPWTPWNGGECPVEKGTLIDVRYRDGKERNNLRALALEIGRDASVCYWENDGMAEDIIAYRVTKWKEGFGPDADYSNPFIGWRYADEPSGKSTSDATITPWTPAVGDVVTLKSGGPKMTVNSLKDGALCNYFDNDGRLHASYFPASTLNLWKP